MLFKYEFLKLAKRRSTIVLLLLSLFITTIFFSLPVIQYNSYVGDSVMSGLEGITYNRNRTNDLAEVLTEDVLTKLIFDYQQLYENPENVGFDGRDEFLIGEANDEFVAPRLGLLRMVMDNYSPPDVRVTLDNLRDLDLSEGALFYETRVSKIDTLLQNPERELSEQQQDFWLKMNNQVETPFEYGYYEGWSVILSAGELLMFAMLLICVIIAPVFAGEYQSGADAIILSSKYGKTKLIRAKIAAALVFGLLAFSLNVIIACSIPLVAFGTGGWHLPIQLSNSVIPYALTFLQATLITLAVIYVVLLGMMSLTLLISANMKSPYFVLMMIVPLFFIPIFLVPDGTTGFYNLLIYLLPYRATLPSFGGFITYQLVGIIFDALRMRVLLYGAILVLTLPLAGLSFKRHQVSG